MTSVTRRDLFKLAAAPLAAAQKRRPNVLMILSDDLGFECLSCYGSLSYRTPNLDRFASQGVRFTHGYAQPLCTPTRVQLMTGQYNDRNWKAFGVMDPKEKTFGHWMSAAGYRTAIAGKWQMYSYNPPDFEPEWRGKGQRPEDAGFHEYSLWHAFETEDKGSRYGDPTWYENGKLHKDAKGKYGDDVSAEFLMKFMENNRTQPFFAYFPMALTHGPYNPSPRGAKWNTARLKNDPANFKDMVEYMDDVIGRVVRKVDDLGLGENTLILYFSDNGTGKEIRTQFRDERGERVIRGGKGLTTDAGTRVPCMARWTGTVSGGRVLDDLIDSSDFWPTIAGACGVAQPKGVPCDGRSFLPQLLGQRAKPRDWTYCHYDPRPGHGKEAYTKLVRYARTQRYKLYDDGRLFDIPADELEQRPIAAGSEPTEAAAARKMLRAVIESRPKRSAGHVG